MKSLGLVRKLDQLGRIVLPMETRRSLDMKDGDPIEMFIDGDKVILRKYQNQCIFCGEQEDLLVIQDKPICKKCVSVIKDGRNA